MAVETSRSVALSVVAPRVQGRRAVTAGTAAVVAIGTLSSGLVLPVGVTIVIGLVGFAGVLLARASAARMRAAFVAAGARRARAQRRRARERALAGTDLGAREVLAELVRLVDEIEASAPDVAGRFELDELLDRHVVLAVAHARAVRASTMFDRTQLERTRDGCRSEPHADTRRLELCERRLRTHDQCRARVQLLANELAILADLIRLLAQRAACPDDPVLDDRIDRQLTEMDEDDAARSSLAAELS